MLPRRGQSDERRRRVLSEDTAHKTTTAPSGRTAVKTDGAKYEPGVLDRQPRIVDLIPRAAWAHALLLVVGLGLAGGLVAIQRWSTPGAWGAAILDPHAAGSLASWFSSMLLAGGTAVSMICYALRRQRQSDYHGRYRIWLWTAGLVMMMSVAATSPWHVVLGEMAARTTGIAASGGGVLWWLGLSALVMSYVAVRLLLEIRGCRASTCGLVAAALAYAAVGAAHLQLGLAVKPATVASLAACGWLLGHVLLVASFLWYARHTVLDMQGLIQPKVTESAKTEVEQAQVAAAAPAPEGESSESPKTPTASQGTLKRRRDAAHATPPAPKRRSDVETDMPPTKRAARLLETADFEEDRFEEEAERVTQRRQRKPKRSLQPREEELEDDQPDIRKLSKSDRKRLRKLKTEQRRAA